MPERRYNEDEVRLIFQRAAEAQQSATPAERQLRSGEGGEGMSLADLHAIGREVGIPAELVDQAAQALGRPAQVRTRRLLGLPIGVGRTVELGRKLSDAEWERLVVDLRETFDARGRVRSEGGLKQWTNGNLQALLEPGVDGDRLRMRTVKGNSRAMIGAGAGLVVASAVTMAVSAVAGGGTDLLERIAILVTTGAALFAFGAIQLPAWARQRRRQMEAIARRLTAPGEAVAQTTED